MQANELPYNDVEYLKDIVYNGFMAFEAMTERNLESVICDICGVCPEVHLGDGNEKNCWDNSQVGNRAFYFYFKRYRSK